MAFNNDQSSVILPPPPVANRRTDGLVGLDLQVTFHTDLFGCESLMTGNRYITLGNFRAGVWLAFSQPLWWGDVYPNLLSEQGKEREGLALILTMFKMGQGSVQQDWENQWFTVTAPISPNVLNWPGMGQEMDDLDDAMLSPLQSSRAALIVPRDDGLVPIVPRRFSGEDENSQWPASAPKVSFAGPLEFDAFELLDSVNPPTLKKTSVFVKLGTYLAPENNLGPGKGIHVYYVLIVFPVDQNPWKGLAGWMAKSTNPFSKNQTIVGTGRVMGVLNRDIIRGPRRVDPSVRILVILPDSWEFVRHAHVASNNGTSVPTSSQIPEGERPGPGPGGVISRNPFSPSRARTRPATNGVIPITPPETQPAAAPAAGGPVRPPDTRTPSTPTSTNRVTFADDEDPAADTEEDPIAALPAPDSAQNHSAGALGVQQDGTAEEDGPPHKRKRQESPTPTAKGRRTKTTYGQATSK